MSTIPWYIWALMTVICWGTYGVCMHTGSASMKDPEHGRIMAFLWVGLAYFLTAVIAPIVILKLQGGPIDFWNYPAKGWQWSLIAGTLGAMETTLDPILAMFEMADKLARDDAPEVTRLLAAAQVARGESDRAPLLAEARRRQQNIQEVLKQLLLRLEEWNDYQDLVQEVRALRDRQRDLQNRTQEARGK